MLAFSSRGKAADCQQTILACGKNWCPHTYCDVGALCVTGLAAAAASGGTVLMAVGGAAVELCITGPLIPPGFTQCSDIALAAWQAVTDCSCFVGTCTSQFTQKCVLDPISRIYQCLMPTPKPPPPPIPTPNPNNCTCDFNFHCTHSTSCGYTFKRSCTFTAEGSCDATAGAGSRCAVNFVRGRRDPYAQFDNATNCHR